MCLNVKLAFSVLHYVTLIVLLTFEMVLSETLVCFLLMLSDKFVVLLHCICIPSQHASYSLFVNYFSVFDKNKEPILWPFLLSHFL